MPTLKYRRLRGDMIETFKIINSIYDRDVTEGLLDLDQNTRTRGNDKNLKKKYSKLNIRKFSFTNRIVDIWNSLPNEVITAKTVKCFEINLDKYWEAQEFKYDHTANINLTSKPGSDVKSRSSIVEEEVDIVVSANTCQNSPITKTPPSKTPSLFTKTPPFFFTKMPPLFFRIKVILPKRPHFFIAKTAHLMICFYSSEDTCIMCDVL